MKAKFAGGIDTRVIQQRIALLEQAEQAAIRTIREATTDRFTGYARENLVRETSSERAPESELERANATLRDTRGLIGPFQALVRSIAMLDSEVDLGRLGYRDVGIELSVRQSLLRSLGIVAQAFVAAGPDLEKHLPMDLLVVLETNVQAEIDFLTGREKDLRGSEPPPLARRQSFSWEPMKPKPIPEPVRLTTAKLPDLESSARELERLLGGEISARILAVAPADRERFATAVLGWTLLADTAVNALDYARVGARMFGHPDNRRSHQARDYDRSMVDASRPRQAQSKQQLLQDVLQALDAKDPAAAFEANLAQSFAREAGFPAGAAEDWKSDLSALVRALDEDVLIPLRSLYACAGTVGFTQYSDQSRAEMKQFVVRVARAVVEGDFEKWRATHSASRVQLECLGSPENVERWLGSITRESEGAGGGRFTTHEAAGNELFWATKVGGPSHAFDTMPQCILSLLGNARTKAIVLDDSRWHEAAARAYMRLLPSTDGRRMIFLEDAQIDFPYRDDSSKCDWNVRSSIERRIVEHAIEKAKQISAALITTGPYAEIVGTLGAVKGCEPMVLHPSGAVIEASDTLGMHDWPQGFTQTVFPKTTVYMLSEAKIAAL